MNRDLYIQLIEQFKFITEPLWELYGSYNGYLGSPLLGALFLGLITSTYPSQITYNLASITYITNQMVHKANWWKIVISFFFAKVLGVYLIARFIFGEQKDWINTFLEGIRYVSGFLYLLLGILFLLTVPRNNIRSKYMSFFKAFLISLCLSVIIDPVALSILTMFIPWIANPNMFLGWSVPFFYTLATFIPIWIFSILSYGFKLDVFLRKNAAKKQIYYLFGFTLIILAFNQFFLYWW